MNKQNALLSSVLAAITLLVTVVGSVKPTKAMTLPGPIVMTLSCTGVSGTWQVTADRDNSGFGNEFIDMVYTDGAGTVLLTLSSGVIVGSTLTSTFPAEVPYFITPSYNPITARFISRGGNGLLERIDYTQTFTCPGLPLFSTSTTSTTVEFFNPNDGRVDAHPGDRLAVWCSEADKIVLYGAANDMPSPKNGFFMAVFSYQDVKAAGAKGLSKTHGNDGTVSISLIDGWFWIAWNGGQYKATGQDTFVKNFSDDVWCGGAHKTE
jgi:hypothetical protein